MTRRLISHSEIEKVYDCQAKHAFSYTGHLTGGKVLKPQVDALRLRRGKAWGIGVATFHQADPDMGLALRYGLALIAMEAALEQDAVAMRKVGIYVESDHADLLFELRDLLWHYVTTTDPLQISDPEFELILPIPSRSGRGVSNRYFFQAYLDGIATEDRRLWLAEYKLRDSLSDYEDIVRMQQLKRYVWAAERRLGIAIAGVIVDERLSRAPEPARWVKAKRKGEGINGRVPSEAKDQYTTGALYIEACLEADAPINEDTVRALDARKWQQRHRVIFKRSEIEDAGRELVSAAHQIQLLDSAALFPVRHSAPWRCRGCQFKEICTRTDDRELIETNFDLRDPKRLRELALEGAAR